ncbi:hypothetical protein [Nocardia sp. NPDC127526]|uniref:hypothetical protein n=1 Tax=Nocardia sp. NPDC127526 TaxID=3345393 RepID=UPI00363FDFBD
MVDAFLHIPPPRAGRARLPGTPVIAALGNYLTRRLLFAELRLNALRNAIFRDR